MVKEMINIAAECLKNPGKKLVWSSEQQKYICPERVKHTRAAVVQQAASAAATAEHPALSQQFTLIFSTAAGGTLLFVLLCFGCSFAAGKQPPPLLEKLIMGFFDLAKIGFGTIVGLLGGGWLAGDRSRSK